MTRLRADLLLVKRGLFESRAKAQAAIAAGLVTANGARIEKASDEIPLDAALEGAPAHPYVSRGGVKLAAALDHFRFDPRGRVCLDVGASTGGFTEALLERGATKVFAVDVGAGQLHARLRGDARVAAMEATDIRALDPSRFDQVPAFVTIDVSFISLRAVLPAATALVASPRSADVELMLIALIKPQFEAGRAHLKKGIVRDPAVHQAVCKEIAALAASLGWAVAGIIESPLPGAGGNREFLLGASRT